MGRLFDAVAALIGVRQTVTYEAQAAMELEALAIPNISSPYPYTLSDGTIDPGPMLHAIVNDLKSGTSVPQISGRFHYTLVDIVDTISQQLRASTGIGTVALSGGVFQNVTLLQQAVSRLSQSGFTVLTHRLVPPNDGGLALGQAMVAHFSRQL
jgi:hydrogenase maturation protein HypF